MYQANRTPMLKKGGGKRRKKDKSWWSSNIRIKTVMTHLGSKRVGIKPCIICHHLLSMQPLVKGQEHISCVTICSPVTCCQGEDKLLRVGVTFTLPDALIRSGSAPSLYKYVAPPWWKL